MSQENFLESDLSFSPVNENCSIRVKVIGVGGAGLSLVDGLTLDNFNGVEHLAVDVDSRALNDAISSDKLLIGRRHTLGMGTGVRFLLAERLPKKRRTAFEKT